MIYLQNTTEKQTVFIERNDGLGTIHGNSYEQGYEDGVIYQKSLLSETAITSNGDYSSENGWSGVSISVPQTAVTAKLESKNVSISADTTNILPTSGYDAMSAVTVDASEYAQTNYDSGFDDGFTDGFASGNSTGYESGYTSGYTSGYSSGYTSGVTAGIESEKQKMSAITFTANTAVTLADGSYSAVTVNVPQTGTSAVLGTGSFSANGTYSASTDNLDGYSALTVNVGQLHIFNGKSLLLDVSDVIQLQHPVNSILTSNGKYIGNGKRIVVKCHKNNSGFVSSEQFNGVYCSFSDNIPQSYTFALSSKSIVYSIIESNDYKEDYIEYKNIPLANGWEDFEFDIAMYGSAVTLNCIADGNNISRTITGNFLSGGNGLFVTIGRRIQDQTAGKFAFEYLKSYDITSLDDKGTLSAYVVYDDVTRLLYDVMNDIQFTYTDYLPNGIYL